jgi:DNA polymerase-3 subunit epsilon
MSLEQLPDLNPNPTLEAFLDMIREGAFLVLDTETTGLKEGEIVQIAVANSAGNALLDTFVRPNKPIPPDATRIHGITDAMVATAPMWADVQPMVLELLDNRDVVVYNAVYDRRMMHQSDESNGLSALNYKGLVRFWCAMTAFAEVYGEWNDYRGSFTWQSLKLAAAFYHIQQPAAHSALGDCLTTLDVCLAMAGVRRAP